LALFSPSGLGKAEKAYLFLGFTAAFSNGLGDDEVRRRRFSALLRAEMRRRNHIGFGDRAVEFSFLTGRPDGEKENHAILVTDR
jgi:hypothetical protein